MATLRHHVRIARTPDEVWAVVADAGSISAWFPGIEQSSLADGVRRCSLGNGAELVEDVVTSDDSLRRFQYRITGGAFVPEYHLGTIDVLEDGDGSLVVYSTEVLPDRLKAVMDPTIAAGVQGLADHLG